MKIYFENGSVMEQKMISPCSHAVDGEKPIRLSLTEAEVLKANPADLQLVIKNAAEGLGGSGMITTSKSNDGTWNIVRIAK